MTCIDRWNRDVTHLDDLSTVLNQKNESEDPYKRAALHIEQRIARRNIAMPLYRVLLNGNNNFPVLKYHVRANIDNLKTIHDRLYYINYEGVEKDCMKRSAEIILELYAKLGSEGL